MNARLVAAMLAALAVACGSERPPKQGKTGSGDHVAAQAKCSPQGDSSMIDATWAKIDPGHPLVPVELKMPPTVEGKLITLSATEAIYMIKAPGTEALLQLGIDRVQSPDDFKAQITSQGGTTEIESHASKLGGKDAVEACGTLEVPLPHAVMPSGSGGVKEVPAHIQKAHYGGYFVKVGDRMFRATYRIPDKEAAQWEPVFRTILSTITWK